jgi:hypothetical protein
MRKYMGINRLLWMMVSGSFALCLGLASDVFARDVDYLGKEETIYVTPGEPTQIAFPGQILGGYKRKRSSLSLERQDNYLILFGRPELPAEGEAIIVILDDRRSYALRVLPSSDSNGRDELITIKDDREIDPEVVAPNGQTPQADQPVGYAPSNTVSGLMREMILMAEFGRQKPIAGYRRSNKYSGETILQDGALKATIDEMYLGSDLWGYVVTVENLVDSTQRINPASFRLDGTKAVVAERWELAARPLTAEQQVANEHTTKLYIITKSKRG